MKKLYMLAAGALCAAMASAANGDVTDGWLMLEDFENNPVVPTVWSPNGSESGEATIETLTSATGDETNHAAKFAGNNSRRDSGMKFTFTLPENTTIADYKTVAVDIYTTNGNYRKLTLYANDTKITTVNNAVGGGSNKWYEKKSIAINIEGTGQGITLFFSLDQANSENFYIDNICLEQKEKTVDPDPIDPTEPDASTNGTVTDGILMLEDFQGMALGTECIWHKGGNNDATGKVAVDETKASNYVAELTTTNWDNYIEVNVTLPAGKTLKNYKNIIFDFYRYSGDDNYKKMLVYADDEEIYLDGNYVEQGKEKEWKRDKKYAIPATTNAGNSFKLRIGLNGTNKGHYAVDNIRLEERTEPIGTYDESKNGTVTDGWLMVEDFQNMQPGDEIKLAAQWGSDLGTTPVAVDPVADKPGNLVVTYSKSDDDYNTVLSINVTLPEGKTLKDYGKIAFDIYRFSDDKDNKQMFVKAGSDQIHLDEGYPSQADAETWTTKEYEIASTVEAGNSFTLLFGIKSDGPHYAVDNVRLQEREEVAEIELDGEPEVTISHDTAAGEMTVAYSFNVKNYNGEEVKVVATVDGHSEVVFDGFVPETEKAPMRAAAESVPFSGNLKATHEVLKTLSAPQVTLTATAGEKELFSVQKAPDSTTGIADITVDSETEAEYFNLQGIRIANPEPGQLYIRRQGSKAVKIRF